MKVVKYLLILSAIASNILFAQWENITSNLPGGKIAGSVIDACDSNTIIINGGEKFGIPQHLYLSIDGGSNWEDISPLTKWNESINDIAIIDKNNIWFVTSGIDSARILNTSDGGNNWNVQFNDSNKTKFFNYIEMFDENNGIAMGDDVEWGKGAALFLKTNDGGRTWISQNDSAFGGWSGDSWRRLDFSSSSTGYFLATGNLEANKHLYKTDDFGQSWIITNFIGGTSILKFYNDNIGLAYRGKYDGNTQIGGIMNRTEDAGNTWQEFEMEATGWGNDIEFLPNDVSQVWFTDYKNLYFSSEFGETWTIQSIVVDELKGRDIVFVDEKHGWIICDDALYYTNNNGGLLTDIVEPEGEEILTKFTLEQNYPNPFNPTTTIKYSIPNLASSFSSSKNVVLKVYDIIGNEIVELVNKQKSAGNYEVTFDASQISSGVYYYQLVVGEFIQTKKMILIK